MKTTRNKLTEIRQTNAGYSYPARPVREEFLDPDSGRHQQEHERFRYPEGANLLNGFAPTGMTTTDFSIIRIGGTFHLYGVAEAATIMKKRGVVMKRRNYWTICLAMIIACMMMVTACAGGSSSNSSTATGGDTAAKAQQPTAKAPEPVKLIVFDSLFNDEEFNSLIQSPITKHFPNITLERMKSTSGDIPGDLQKLIVGGAKPDVLFAPIFHYQMLSNLDIIADISDRIKKDNVNVKAWNPQIQKYLLQAGDGKYVALPLYRNIQALFYNKSLFDQFGVPYPKDGMTYDQALDLARKMTRTQDGVDYYGLDLANPASQLGQLSANFLDAKTNVSLINTEPYKKVLELHKQDFDIPGMKFFTVAQGQQFFYKDKKMAMIIEWMAGFTKQIAGSTVDWDMVTMPVFADKPNVHSKIDFHAGYVTKVSAHSDAAAQMIEYLSTNKDVQTQISLTGRVPVIDDEAVLKQFGADSMKGKNIAILQKTVMANIPPTSLLENQWAQTGAQLMNVAYNPAMQGKKDINTALREADEASNKAVQDFLGKK